MNNNFEMPYNQYMSNLEIQFLLNAYGIEMQYLK